MSYCPLPDTHSRVILKSQGEDDFLTTYINANYLKVSIKTKQMFVEREDVQKT